MKRGRPKKQPTLQELADEQLRLANEQLKKAKEQEAKVNRLLAEYEKRLKTQQKSTSPARDVSFKSLDPADYTVHIYPNKNKVYTLTRSRIKEIPIRDLKWFQDQAVLRLIAYSTDGKEIVFLKSIWHRQDQILFELQKKGYRFIHNSESAFLSVAKDCGTCRNAHKCPMRIQTSTLCPATDKLEAGYMHYAMSTVQFEELTSLDN